METNSEVYAETPDMDFSENIAIQETPDINFSEIGLDPAPDTDTANKSHERFTTEDSDIDDLDEPDQYVEGEDDSEDARQDSSNKNNNSESAPADKSKSAPKSQAPDNRLVHLPSARVKHIMKCDQDVTLITGECTFLVTKATELFIESLAREAFLHTLQAKKKTVQKRDVDAAIENVESLMFLEGMMNI
ncbi:DNA polymerase epsilon subunit 4 [Sitodiplosis mosellana]|uniref:DNA polymerase epsilon subunit 4 n=1 Tax=Sitodiplosis mosellana TaxID=263140 RepID=UPI002444C003|nr:DNA polymerase epsilon subunit 4 [Sitodiplosis mosellana]